MRENAREKIVAATLELIENAGEAVDEITVRDICEAAGVGLGLVNYYFAGKDALVAECVQRIITGTVQRFEAMCKATRDMPPFERLETLMNAAFAYLFEHRTISRISILTDMASEKPGDNTAMTVRAFTPLLKAASPRLTAQEAEVLSRSLVYAMQGAFLRPHTAQRELGLSLASEEGRKRYLRALLGAALERRV